MERDLGRLAQAILSEWAAQVSITANPSTSDLEGWDFILQFPLQPPATGVPLDRRPSRIECLIQVKGTGSTDQSEPVKLSNWEKLVASPLPAFFLIIDFGSGVSPQDSYLVHVGEQWIGKVLRRLRQISDTDKASLNQHTLNVTWSEGDKLESQDGKGLESAIRKHIGNDFDVYVQGKKRLRESLGQDVQVKVTFTSSEFKSTDDMYEEMIDFAIGIRDSISVSALVIEKDVRFGIPAERVEYQGGEIALTDRTQFAKHVILRISNLDGTARSTFAAELHSPLRFDPNATIPKEKIRVRVVSEIGDLILFPFTDRPGFSIELRLSEGAKIRKLSELVTFWRAISVFQNVASQGLVIEIDDGENPPYHQEVTTIEQSVEVHGEMIKAMATAVTDAWYLVRLVDLPDDPELTIEQIAAQKDALRNIHDLTNPNVRIFSMAVCFVGDDPNTDKDFAFTYSRVLTRLLQHFHK